jgi:hypothetical protein
VSLCESKRSWFCSCRVARPIASFHKINRTVSPLSTTALRSPLPRERFSPLADCCLMPTTEGDPMQQWPTTAIPHCSLHANAVIPQNLNIGESRLPHPKGAVGLVGPTPRELGLRIVPPLFSR